MKKLGYLIFAFFFYIFYLLPINKDKIFLIMTHDGSEEGNVGASYKYFKEHNKNLIFKTLTRDEYDFSEGNKIRKIFSFFIKVPYDIATSKNILMGNVFLAFAYLNFKKSVNIVQLWHGSGTIKKFGLDTEEGLIKELATKANKKNTHLIIESESMRNEYKSAFGMEDSKIFSTGCPRTDIFFDVNTIQNKIANFYSKYSELKNKKIILYAPTFRDKGDNDLDNNLNITKILANTSEDYVIGLRLHPHISKNFNFNSSGSSSSYGNRVYNFTDFEGVNTLLLVSDILISDYSSIIFEYSLLNRDMVFFPHDFSSFEKSERGFYRDYMNFVPGSVVKSTEELILELKFIINYHKTDSKAKFYTNHAESNESINIYNNKSTSYNHTKINNFRKEFMEKSDGNASKRLFELLYG